VFNKRDLVVGDAGPFAGIATSAVRGDGIEALQRAIAGRLVPQEPGAGEPVPFLPRHFAALAAARAAIVAGQVPEAQAWLERLRAPESPC
jgi:hypothetical protein